jgi:hypothetical protein
VDVFQVTITAEEQCLYMCWSRLKLERVLRHRPLLKVVLSNIIGEVLQTGNVVAEPEGSIQLTPKTAIGHDPAPLPFTSDLHNLSP